MCMYDVPIKESKASKARPAVQYRSYVCVFVCVFCVFLYVCAKAAAEQRI